MPRGEGVNLTVILVSYGRKLARLRGGLGGGIGEWGGNSDARFV